MNFLMTNSPAYKSVAQVSQVTTVQTAHPAISSGLTGFFGSMLGSSTPTYKTVGGQSLQVPASSGLWSIFGISAPSYKTAPVVADEPNDADEPIVDDSDACDPGPDNIVVL